MFMFVAFILFFDVFAVSHRVRVCVPQLRRQRPPPDRTRYLRLFTSLDFDKYTFTAYSNKNGALLVFQCQPLSKSVSLSFRLYKLFAHYLVVVVVCSSVCAFCQTCLAKCVYVCHHMSSLVNSLHDQTRVVQDFS